MKRKDGWKQRHATWIDRHGMMMPAPRGALSYFACGVSDGCPKNDGGTHVWDGPGIEDELMSAATCSKCGVDAMTHSLWNAP
jgi:hypothetical protein